MPVTTAPSKAKYKPSASWVDRYNNENRDEYEVAGTVHKIGEWLEFYLGPTHAQAAIGALVGSLMTGGDEMVPAERDRIACLPWREALAAAHNRINWPDLVSTLTDLYAYGAGGVINADHAKREGERARLLGYARKALYLLPSAWNQEQSIRDTITLALARERLDEGQDLTLEEIALLGDVAMQTVRNAASNGAFGRIVDKKVRAENARAWLEDRDGFHTSRWREPDDDQWTDGAAYDEDEPEEFVFVPKDRDGELFLPTLARPIRSLGMALGYTIGAKGQERDLADYYEAVAELNRMPTPRWRRPNQKGNWGIVSAPNNRAFERVRKADLDRMIADVRATQAPDAGGAR